MKAFFSDWFSCAVVTAFVWGLVPTFEKAGMLKANPYAAVFVRCLGILVGVLTLAIARPSVIGEAAGLGWKTAGALMLAGILGSIVGQFTNLTALKLGEVSQVSPVTASWPLIAFVIGLLFFAEVLTIKKLVAIAFIISGIFLLRA